MADMFIGVRMTVVLRSGYSMTGVVAQIIPNQVLVLHQVHSNVGQYAETVHIDPNDIEDIFDSSRMPAVTNPSGAGPLGFTAPSANAIPAPIVPSSNTPTFQDPAILSMGRRPGPNIGEKRDPTPPAITKITSLVKTLEEAPGNDQHTPIKRLEESLGKLSIVPPGPETGPETGPEAEVTPTAPSAPGARRKTRRKQKGSRSQPEGENTPVTVKETDEAGGQGGSGSGWRQTPILQSTKSFQPFASLKRGQKPNADGWASEDVTDVQGAGDFDFEGNLTKFDKRNIFQEMRQQDKVDDAERLVSHNRLPRSKPGTAGGKNLHYSENVLDMPSTSSAAQAPGLVSKLKETPDDFWKSEADDTNMNGGERLSGREGSGRSSRLRGESRMSTRRSRSRKASATQSILGPSRINSGQPPPATAEGFYSMGSSRRVETVTHLQMLNLENIAHNEMGLTEDLMAENAGRSIAEVALSALNDPAVTLRNAAASPGPNTPTIVVMAGNNKSSVRAISAGRHLRNRGINVLVCVVGIEREKDLIEEVQKQIRLFRNFGGAVLSKTQLFKQLSKATTSLNSSPQISVTLIVDALLGLSIAFEELRKSDQASTYELMEWANRNEAFVMAVDVPSGIDPTAGKVNIIDGARLYVHPRYVIALGAPKQGLLRAMQIGYEEQADIAVEDWKLYLADIGLGASTIWRKAATKLRRGIGIDFGDKWVMEMRYQQQLDKPLE
ncbi:YjeF-related protein N-terminus-domain-containing protein [Pseudomassariella vexata]|uniref:Enhancer of mRNA-decapping protein 3 n=1 Tax=Pseudomassariella vexata TaxID=1141098 RepID=A0A1Y2DIH9_9PEZI|nr:YjeF-related protein N-terminus-domain-containing protein [Pseudomassariella vexata]ORY59049.1 YjeF-related protein N-terminus-domain-containing protein [Pseudomassariella vexata]